MRVAILLASAAVFYGMVVRLRREIASRPDRASEQRLGLVMLVAATAGFGGGAADGAVRVVWSSVPAALPPFAGVAVGLALAVVVGAQDYRAEMGGGRWYVPLVRTWRVLDMTNTSRALVAAIVDCWALVLWVAAPNGNRPPIPAAILALCLTVIGFVVTRHWWKSRGRASPLG
jgi:hypothetical protein